jgi:hypothetical protein
MKRTAMFLVIAIVCAGIGWAAYHAALPSEPPLSKYVPAGPLLYLEAKDFSSLLADWNFSPQKKRWVESSNYEVFSRSRLFLRLHGAGDEFAAAAGLPPDMNFLSQIAGTRSALALYDIGNLQFLYITYLPSAKSMQTTLWQTRAKFEPRSAGGVNFYLRRDPESQKEVAFAVSGDYLLLATREDLLAGALQLMSGSENRTIETEQWWSQSVAAAGPVGDLRMVLNLEKIVPSPYFRTYWVQQNITETKQYSAAISDLFRSGQQYREERVLLRKAPSAASSADGFEATADLVRLVPDSAGIYEAKVHPSADSCLELLETKLLAPHLGPAPPSQIAPQVQLTSGETGGGSDLETRIDQPPVQRPPTPQNTTALKELLGKTQLLASLQVQSTERDKAGVFVRIHSAAVLLAASDWNGANVQSALADFVRPGLTASQFGVAWQQKSGYQEFDGLWPLVVSVRGKYLLVSDDPNLIAAMLSNFNRKSDVKPAGFIAGFSHESERANFARFSSVVDRPNQAQSSVPGMERQPQFFSENMASLSSTLAEVAAERITVRTDGARVIQTVTYEWSK